MLDSHQNLDKIIYFDSMGYESLTEFLINQLINYYVLLACLSYPTVSLTSQQETDEVRMNALMMVVMMMMKCFCGLVDQRNSFSLISSQDHSFIANL